MNLCATFLRGGWAIAVAIAFQPAWTQDTPAGDPRLEPRLAEVRRVLREVPLIDGHNDLPWQCRVRFRNQLSRIDLRRDLTHLDPRLHTDIPRLRRGGVGAQFWSVYVPTTGYDSVQAVLEQIDVVHQLIARYADVFELALTAADIERIHASGKIGSLIGIEGGHAIGNSLAVLRQLYSLGARYMTLTHSDSLDWADSAAIFSRSGGIP